MNGAQSSSARSTSGPLNIVLTVLTTRSPSTSMSPCIISYHTSFYRPDIHTQERQQDSLCLYRPADSHAPARLFRLVWRYFGWPRIGGSARTLVAGSFLYCVSNLQPNLLRYPLWDMLICTHDEDSDPARENAERRDTTYGQSHPPRISPLPPTAHSQASKGH